MDRESRETDLPASEECYERVRRVRFGRTVSCIDCGEAEPVIRKGTTTKDAQQYYCRTCETYFNDLTGSFFEHRKFSIEEMFYMIEKMESMPTAQVASTLDRDYGAVLHFRRDLRKLCSQREELTLSDLRVTDVIDVTTRARGVENGLP